MQSWYSEEEIHDAHYGIIRNADPGLVSLVGGHLEYREGKGVRQKQQTSCRKCRRLGLDNGEWHPVK